METLSESLAARLEQHRGELVVHCYRMTGGYSEAEDLVQETFARALGAAEKFEERASVRTWLYRIATNLCHDVVRSRARHRTLPFAVMEPLGDGSWSGRSDQPWVEPIPDRVLDDVPEDVAVVRETIELAFVVAIQELPARQRTPPARLMILRGCCETICGLPTRRSRCGSMTSPRSSPGLATTPPLGTIAS